MPTRLPYGISFVKPGSKVGAYTLQSKANPSVALGTVFITPQTAMTITNFVGGELGKVIIVVAKSAGAITLQNSAGGINLFGGVTVNSAGYLYSATTGNYTMGLNEAVMLVHIGTGWSQIVGGVRVDGA